MTSDAMTEWSDNLLGGDAYAINQADGAKYFGF